PDHGPPSRQYIWRKREELLLFVGVKPPQSCRLAINQARKPRIIACRRDGNFINLEMLTETLKSGDLLAAKQTKARESQPKWPAC
ncbi:MAG: hypothetical protein IK125_01995, partial [Lachnospiraceae bacterium]|nr:hypothetical protein [Lachnospiraceae bacterium]